MSQMTSSKKDELNEWKWQIRPSNVSEFNAMMLSLDRHLSSKGLPPSQRSMRASMQLSWTLGLDGTPIFGGSADRSPDFSSRDLLARVHRKLPRQADTSKVELPAC